MRRDECSAASWFRAAVAVVVLTGVTARAPMVHAQQTPPELPQLSPAARVDQRVGLTDFSVKYSSPAVKDRKIWGDLVPYDKLWRTGANAATTLQASRDFRFGGKPVPAGTYSLYTIPGKSSDRIVLASHFDTKLFRELRFVGASDGASSTAALIELGRVIKARGQLPFTIELLFLDGEEAVIEWQGTDNTYGSRYYVEAGRKAGTLKSLRAFILLDMIGDRNLTIRRESNSTRWLTDIVWGAAKKLGHRGFMDEETTVEDDHIPFVKAGVPSLDIIDLDYPQWHTAQDTLDAVAARSLQVVGETVVESLPLIEQRLLKQ